MSVPTTAKEWSARADAADERGLQAQAKNDWRAAEDDFALARQMRLMGGFYLTDAAETG